MKQGLYSFYLIAFAALFCTLALFIDTTFAKLEQQEIYEEDDEDLSRISIAEAFGDVPVARQSTADDAATTFAAATSTFAAATSTFAAATTAAAATDAATTAAAATDAATTAAAATDAATTDAATTAAASTAAATTAATSTFAAATSTFAAATSTFAATAAATTAAAASTAAASTAAASTAATSTDAATAAAAATATTAAASTASSSTAATDSSSIATATTDASSTTAATTEASSTSTSTTIIPTTTSTTTTNHNTTPPTNPDKCTREGGHNCQNCTKSLKCVWCPDLNLCMRGDAFGAASKCGIGFKWGQCAIPGALLLALVGVGIMVIFCTFIFFWCCCCKICCGRSFNSKVPKWTKRRGQQEREELREFARSGRVNPATGKTTAETRQDLYQKYSDLGFRKAEKLLGKPDSSAKKYNDKNNKFMRL